MISLPVYITEGIFEEELYRLDIKKNLPITVIMADINGLKLLNDSFGHNKGDEALIKVAELLKANSNSKDIVARLGGDEFAVIMLQDNSNKADEFIK